LICLSHELALRLAVATELNRVALGIGLSRQDSTEAWARFPLCFLPPFAGWAAVQTVVVAEAVTSK
jgi:hypothetical protein